MTHINCFFDGSCTHNGFKDISYGASSFVILFDDIIVKEDATFYRHITNNQMELQGIIDILKYLLDNDLQNHKISIYGDSMYALGVVKSGDYLKSNNWKRGKSTPANIEYCQEIYELNKNFSKIEYIWTKGHNKSIDILSEWNEYCDQLCTSVINKNGGVSFEESNFGKLKQKA